MPAWVLIKVLGTVLARVPRSMLRGVLALLLALVLPLVLAAAVAWPAGAQDDAPRRLDVGRFTAVYFPADHQLARALLASASRNDSFPWLPRPRQRVLLAIAPDRARFWQWVGPSTPEWGAAVAFPESRRIVMQGRGAGSDAGDPREVFRHELAHLALHERLGNRMPRWFDEGYASLAAREWRREDVLAANVALALRGTPSLDELERGFQSGTLTAQASYALAYRAVTELASMDRERGLTTFFRYWEEDRSLDRAVRRAFGITLDGFEKQFRARTRRQYGGLALFADLSLASLVLLILLLPFIIARRLRDRRRLATMRAQEAAAEHVERESAIAAMMNNEESGARERPPESDAR